MYFCPDGPTPPHSPKEAPFFEVHVGPSGPSVTYGMRSRRDALALPVKRSGGIQGMSIWQSAEIRVKVMASPSWVGVAPIIIDPAPLRFTVLIPCLVPSRRLWLKSWPSGARPETDARSDLPAKGRADHQLVHLG